MLNVLHVLGRLAALEARQSELLATITAGVAVSREELLATGAIGKAGLKGPLELPGFGGP